MGLLRVGGKATQSFITDRKKCADKAQLSHGYAIGEKFISEPQNLFVGSHPYPIARINSIVEFTNSCHVLRSALGATQHPVDDITLQSLKHVMKFDIRPCEVAIVAADEATGILLDE